MKKILAFMAALCLLAAVLPSVDMKAAAKETGVKIVVDGEEVLYDGSVGKFSFNGKEVNIKKTPTYVFDDTAYINIKKIVLKALPDVTYSYSKKLGRIRVTRGNCSIEFYIDSPIIYKNGKAEYSRVAPKFIEQDGKAGNYYLPGRLVFETLGYSYTWDSDKKMSIVKETTATGKLYELHKSGVVLDNKVRTSEGSFNGSLKIKLPDGVSKEDITITDDVYKNLICISVRGNHTDFFESLKIKNKCENCVLQIRDEYRIEDDVTVLTIVTQTDKIGLCLLHKDEITDSTLTLTFNRASDLYDKIIILDAGHGDTDPGTQNFGIDEKDCNLIIIKLVGKILEKEGIKVFYSRFDDTLIPLRDRAYLGGRLDADMFVSVHHNANNSPEKNGTSVYYSLNNPNVSRGGAVTSELMAGTIQADLLEALGTNDMNVLTTDFSVTKYNNVPAVLIELSFLSNPEECARSITDEFRVAAAQSIAQSILKLYQK